MCYSQVKLRLLSNFGVLKEILEIFEISDLTTEKHEKYGS